MNKPFQASALFTEPDVTGSDTEFAAIAVDCIQQGWGAIRHVHPLPLTPCVSRVAKITTGRIGPELGVDCPVFFVAAFFAAPDFGFGQSGQAAAVTAGQARNLLA